MQRDYYLRMIEEFAHALALFIQRRQEHRDDADRQRHHLAELYRQYVGPYDELSRLSVQETLVWAAARWTGQERMERLAMLAELLYTEATGSQAPLCTMLYDKAYTLYDYVEANGNTYSIDRQQKMARIRRMRQGE